MSATTALLLKELKAARLAIRKMKAECNAHDEGFEIGKAALKRINSTLNDFRQPIASPISIHPHNTCRKCGGEMHEGVATQQTFTGMLDFPGDKHPCTLSPGGKGGIIPCMKCVDCGWSVTK